MGTEPAPREPTTCRLAMASGRRPPGSQRVETPDGCRVGRRVPEGSPSCDPIDCPCRTLEQRLVPPYDGRQSVKAARLRRIRVAKCPWSPASAKRLSWVLAGSDRASESASLLL